MNMKKFRCKIGLHKYTHIGTQTVNGLVEGFSMSPIMRGVDKCIFCGKIKYIRYNIGSDVHLDDDLNWKPKIV